MLKRHVALAATLSVLQGCSGLVTIKLPAAPKTVSEQQAAPAADPAAKQPVGTAANLGQPNTAAGLIAPPDHVPNATTAADQPPANSGVLAPAAPLAIPTDVGVRLTAALIGESGNSVISNDGGSVISNDGGSVISNDGGSVISNDGGSLKSGAMVGFHVTSLQSTVATFFDVIGRFYGMTVLASNTLLNAIHDMDDDTRTALMSGKRTQVPLVFATIGVQLKLSAGADPRLEVFFPADSDTQVMSLAFKDEQHGTVVLHWPSAFMLPGGLAGGFKFASTFDRVQNRAEVDAYFDDRESLSGRHRLHMSVQRPATLVAGGPILQVRLSRSVNGSADSDLPNGVVEATGYGLADGSAATIGGLRPLGASTPLELLVNPDAAANNAPPHGFYLDTAGRQLTKPTAALIKAVPPDDDLLLPYVDANGVKGYYPDPDEHDFSADPVFSFPQ